MKKIFKILIPVCIIILVIILFVVYSNFNNSNYYGKWTLKNKYIEGKFSDVKINSIESALNSLEDVKDQIGIESVQEELVASDRNNVNLIEENNYFYFDQLYKGIKVYDGGIIVRSDIDGNAKGIVNNCMIIEDLSIKPKYSQEQIKNMLADNYGYEIEYLKPELIVYCHEDNTCELAYYCKYDKGEDAFNFEDEYIVSANTGEIIDKISNVYFN